MADSVYDASLDAVTVSQIMSTDVQSNVAVFNGRYSGGLAPQHVSVLSGEPRVVCKTGDIVTLLTGVGTLSSGLSVGGYGGGLFPWNERTAGGTFDSTSKTISSTQGFAYVQSIDAQQDSEEGATATFEYIPTWDGSTLPLVVNTGVTLAGQSFVSAFGLGPVKIGSTAIPGITGVSIKPGITVTVKRYQGDIFTSACYVTKLDPQFVLTFEDSASMYAFTAMYSAIASNAIIYLRKRTAGGTYVSNATTTNLSFTLTGGMTVTDSVSGSNQDNSQKQITIHGKSLAYSTATAITPGS